MGRVDFTKLYLDRFISQSCLGQTDIDILTEWAKGHSRVEISIKMNMSVSCVDKHLKKIRKRYDMVQKDDDILPPRK